MRARRGFRLPDRSMSEMNITPLIDVMLSLLVIFMIAAPVMTGAIHLPFGGKDRPENPPKNLELLISADGSVSGHGAVLSDLELQAELYAFAVRADAGLLQLQPSRDTRHQRLIDVLSLARSAGLSNIAIGSPLD